MIRWGVVGCSRVQKHVIPDILSTKGMSVGRIGSRSAVRESAYALAGVGTQTGTYAEVCDEPAIDAVFISIPDCLHEGVNMRFWSLQ